MNYLFVGYFQEEESRGEPVREETPGQYGSEESDADSETDYFIVDDEGRPLRDGRKKRKPIFTDATLQEAQDIFGVDFDYDEFEKYEDEYYEEDEEDEEEDEYEDEEQRTIRYSSFRILQPFKLLLSDLIIN